MTDDQHAVGLGRYHPAGGGLVVAVNEDGALDSGEDEPLQSRPPGLQLRSGARRRPVAWDVG